MKIRNLMLVALAASMTFVACSKDDGVPDAQGTPKSVTIKLANVVTSSRSTGGAEIEPGQAVTLTKYQVFFSDGTTLYKAKDATNSADAEQYFDNTKGAVPTTGNFHFLPAAVNKVIVIGNRAKIEDVTTEAELNVALNITDEQNADALSLYATSALTPVSEAEDDDVIHPTDNPVYKADLTLAPTIARLYIKNFSCTFSDTPEYTSLKIQKLALNNYYTTNTLAAKTVGGLTNTALTDANVWDWFANLPAGFHNDNLDITLNSADANAGNQYTVTAASGGIYYHIFPGVEPQLVLRAEGDNTPLYLATKSFKSDDQPVTWEAGKIYEMDFAFKATDFDQPDKCIDITVKPVNWVVVTVTPEF